MKKLKTLGAISFALIGGGALASIPLAMTSCGEKTKHPSDKYIKWHTGPFTLGTTSALQNAGVIVGDIIDSSDMVLSTLVRTDASIPPGTSLLLEGNLFSGNKEIYLFTEGTDTLSIGTYRALFKLDVYKEADFSRLEQMFYTIIFSVSN